MAKKREIRRMIPAERGGLYELLMIEGRLYFVRITKFSTAALKRKIKPACYRHTEPVSELMLMYQANLVIDTDKGKIGKIVKCRFGAGPVLTEKQVTRAATHAR